MSISPAAAGYLTAFEIFPRPNFVFYRRQGTRNTVFQTPRQISKTENEPKFLNQIGKMGHSKRLTPQTSKHSALFQTIDLNSFARSQETLNTHQRDRQDHIN